MGNRTSRHRLKNKEVYSQHSQTSSSNKKFDPQFINQLHLDSHYNAVDRVLNHLFILAHSNTIDTDQEQIAMNIHKNALKTAIRHHMNATYLSSSSHQQARQMTYTM